MGGMLEESWEELVTELANVPWVDFHRLSCCLWFAYNLFLLLSDQHLEQTVQNLITQFNIDLTTEGRVYVGRDTRKSSPSLSAALIAGITTAGGSSVDFGLLTTPQLHYIVRCINTEGQYGEATEQGYYEKLANAYLRLSELIGPNNSYTPHVVVDAANGVGAIQLAKLVPYLQGKLSFEIIHDPNGVLNYQCGADYVKVNQREPQSVRLRANQRYASFDGDADRIIYYYGNREEGHFHMLDGDKIAVLVAKYLKETLAKAELSHLEVSIVQTAYANGSSTIYMRDTLNVDTFCVPTGVKHLHRKAEHCQIGVYFEANGHGTILFSSQVIQSISRSYSFLASYIKFFIGSV